MNGADFDYDLIVIGSGPAGQKAAIQGAKVGQRVALIERDQYLGGACVHRGTIPSKTLRENALRLSNLRKNASVFKVQMPEHVEMCGLINRLDSVVTAHDAYMTEQIQRNYVERIHGRASFIDAQHLQVTYQSGIKKVCSAVKVVIATGSYPRSLDNVPVDHEHIFDSDSILSMHYLPHSLVVLGGGVIASEYASIFAALGVKVTMIDRYPQPLGFLDQDLADKFLHHFGMAGGTFIGNKVVQEVCWDGVSQVATKLEGGEVVKSDKLLCAAGRVACVAGLQIENAGLSLNERGLISVDSNCQTEVENIYAAGDVIGPPSLASASMEQGRRACRAAFCLDGRVEASELNSLIPVGIYAIPEISSVGLTESQAVEQYGSCLVGRANFEEIARGQISEIQDGMLKMVADSRGEKLLGVQIVGEEATELIHIGQMGIVNKMSIDSFVENTFNFPTLAEAYRVAALQICGLRPH